MGMFDWIPDINASPENLTRAVVLQNLGQNMQAAFSNGRVPYQPLPAGALALLQENQRRAQQDQEQQQRLRAIAGQVANNPDLPEGMRSLLAAQVAAGYPKGLSDAVDYLGRPKYEMRQYGDLLTNVPVDGRGPGQSLGYVSRPEPRPLAPPVTWSLDPNDPTLQVSSLGERRRIQPISQPGQSGQAVDPFRKGADYQLGATIAKNGAAILKDGQDAESQNAELGVLKDMAVHLDTGTLGTFKQRAREYGKAIGLDLPDASIGQTMEALANRRALDLRKNMPGALSDPDREFLKASFASLDKFPEANRLIIGFLERGNQMLVNRARFVGDYIAERGGYDKEFPKALAEFDKQQGAALSKNMKQDYANVLGVTYVEDAKDYDAIPKGAYYLTPTHEIKRKS